MTFSRVNGIFDSIAEGQQWGYWRNKVEASYSGNDEEFDGWFNQFELKGLEEPTGYENLRLYMSAKGGDSSEFELRQGEFGGRATGGWVDIEWATTGIAAGGIHGGYDPSGASTNLFAASGGVWLETSKLLEMADDATGRADLVKLDIPSVSIGKATLTGAGNNMTDVKFTDVTFLSYASDQPPRIWAAGSMSGGYTAAPVLGESFELTCTDGSHDLTADFTVNTWRGNEWDAKIDSTAYTNTLQKTEVGSGTDTVNITFKGGAAGAYTSTGGTAGTIAGTAAGWAK